VTNKIKGPSGPKKDEIINKFLRVSTEKAKLQQLRNVDEEGMSPNRFVENASAN